MANTAEERPLDVLVLLRTHAARLRGLAGEHGLSDLRIADDGRLVATVAAERTYLDVFAFEEEATAVAGVEVRVVSAGALGNERSDPALADATQL